MRPKEQKIEIKDDIEYTDFSVSNRWMWVRRFICFIIMITLAVHVFRPHCINNSGKTHTVLQTGFPPLENVTGMTIQPHRAVAVAFSPKPTTAWRESWWDRLFPHRHVHLQTVQLPVLTPDSDQVQTTLSICTTQKTIFKNRIASPDLTRCVETTHISLNKDDMESPFGVIEWVPESVIILRKSTQYWLVVQAPTEAFGWVSAENGMSPFGIVQETENGWQPKIDSVPSVMITVEDH